MNTSGSGLKLNISQAISQLPDNPFKFTDLGVFFSHVIEVAIMLAGLLSLFYLIWGAIDWIISGGDKNALESARSKIIASITGLIAVVAIWALFTLIQYFLGLNLIKTTRPGGYDGGSSYNGSLGGGGGGGGIGSNSNNEPSGLRCPGPNCDRCPGSKSRTDTIDCGSDAWLKNAGCKIQFTESADCEKS